MTPSFPSSFLFLPWDWCRRSKKRRPRSFVRPLAARDRRRKGLLVRLSSSCSSPNCFFLLLSLFGLRPASELSLFAAPVRELEAGWSWPFFLLPKCQWPQLGLRGGGGHRISVPFFSFFLIPPFPMVGPGSLSPLFSNTLVVRWVAASAAKLNE